MKKPATIYCHGKPQPLVWSFFAGGYCSCCGTYLPWLVWEEA